MKNIYFLRQNFFLLFLFLSSNIAAQKKQVWSYDFWGQTIDVIIWDNVEYMMSQSPLSFFNGYESIFGDINTRKFNPEAPTDFDKNYKAKWIILNKMLYLYDVEILEGKEKYPDKQIPLEQLTKREFHTGNDIKPNDPSKFPYGILFASWFSGFIYVKRQPGQGESYCDCMYRNEKYNVLGFKNGILISQDSAFSVEISMDSIEIAENIENYKNSLRKLFDYFRISNCTKLLSEKLALKDNQRVAELFGRLTNDELFWNNTRFMCSESPLSIFDNYKKIFPNVWPYDKHPSFCEKNYMAKWTIINNMLYIYDIDFYDDDIRVEDFVLPKPESEKGEKFNREYADRFQAVEKLTEKKFVHIPSFKQKALLADWYSGTLYFKRFIEYMEPSSPFSYTCDPNYEIVIEKGKVKSIEKTNYIIINEKQYLQPFENN